MTDEDLGQALHSASGSQVRRGPGEGRTHDLFLRRGIERSFTGQ